MEFSYGILNELIAYLMFNEMNSNGKLRKVFSLYISRTLLNNKTEFTFF